ncbi:hypothetical protein HK103_001461 [Boothiomyces macroporosus]|uniref:Fatty acid desaturase domain-containing protein n=1 Tax=Boothiomyces macroporosus TaxID=261099 RepID=A0AAD5Y742_9FUNG|nr:hypothetical protein HK103_001461 [Boothiomyces macroporosus]
MSKVRQRNNVSSKTADSGIKGKLAAPEAAKKFSRPNFTLKEIRDRIPAHCFQRSALKSLSYVAIDLSMIAGLVYFASNIYLMPEIVQPFAWVFYWVFQAFVGVGIWILAHDMVFLPYTRSQLTGKKEQVEEMYEGDEPLLQDAPITHVFVLFLMLVFGFPYYLLTNIGGNSYIVDGKPYKGWKTSHYYPWSPLFEKNQFMGIIYSDIGMILWIGVQVALGLKLGWQVPVLHTDPVVPHLNNDEWDFMRGALCTVDRDWGFLNVFFHHITDTHVVHHLFSTMPFYHAQEATEAVKAFLGEHYLKDDTPCLQALWKSKTLCRFVEDEGDVLWYKY